MNLKEILISLLLSARGEVGEGGEVAADTGTSEAPASDQGTGESAPEADSWENAVNTARSQLAGDQETPAEAVETSEAEVDASTQTQGEETFLTGNELNLDPNTFSPENAAIFKRMQGAYTKRMQEVSGLRERASEIDKFYNDAQFAQQVIVGWANKNGYQIVPANGQAQTLPQASNGAPQANADGVPPALIESFKKNLAPELQWMAEPQAKAMWASMQSMMQPILDKQAKAEQQEREGEWQKHADALSSLAPGWEEQEDVMGDLFDFLSDRQALHHPKYGSKIQMLYDLATRGSASFKQAQQRVAQAGKNRVSSGRTTPRAVPSVSDEIGKSKSSQDAWEIAKRHALSQHKK